MTAAPYTVQPLSSKVCITRPRVCRSSGSPKRSNVIRGLFILCKREKQRVIPRVRSPPAAAAVCSSLAACSCGLLASCNRWRNKVAYTADQQIVCCTPHRSALGSTVTCLLLLPAAVLANIHRFPWSSMRTALGSSSWQVQLDQACVWGWCSSADGGWRSNAR